VLKIYYIYDRNKSAALLLSMFKKLITVSRIMCRAIIQNFIPNRAINMQFNVKISMFQSKNAGNAGGGEFSRMYLRKRGAFHCIAFFSRSSHKLHVITSRVKPNLIQNRLGNVEITGGSSFTTETYSVSPREFSQNSCFCSTISLALNLMKIRNAVRSLTQRHGRTWCS